MKSILLLICSLISTGSVSAQWLPLNTNNTNPITGVKFVNSQTGFACGVYGTLLRTQNGGASWQSLNAGTTHSLMSVDAIDGQHVFTARVGIYRTVNGSTFSEVGGLSNYFGTIFAIKFHDGNNGFIIKAGDIFKTTDGGNNWISIYQSGGYINKLQFTSPKVAYAAGGITYDGVNSGEIHKTVDSGNTWQNLHLAADNVTAMHFLNDTVGYIFTLPQGVYKTINGGQSWSSVSGNLTHNVNSIVFADAQTVYATAGGAIYKTTDGCISWLKEYESADTLVGIIQQSPDGSLFAGCNNGVILRKGSTLSIKELEKEKINIYPNPATNVLYIDFRDKRVSCKSIILYSAEGKVVWQANDLSRKVITINTILLAKGIYRLKIMNQANEVLSQTIAIQ